MLVMVFNNFDRLLDFFEIYQDHLPMLIAKHTVVRPQQVHIYTSHTVFSEFFAIRLELPIRSLIFTVEC